MFENHSKHPCRTAHTRDQIFNILNHNCYAMSSQCPNCGNGSIRTCKVGRRELRDISRAQAEYYPLSCKRCEAEYIEIGGQLHAVCYRKWGDRYRWQDGGRFKARMPNEASCPSCGYSYRVPMPHIILGTRAKRTIYKHMKKTGEKNPCPYTIVGWYRPYRIRM
jgi:hypothetical protein